MASAAAVAKVTPAGTAVAAAATDGKKKKKTKKQQKPASAAAAASASASADADADADSNSDDSKKKKRWHLYTDKKLGYTCFKWGGKRMEGAIPLTRKWYYPNWSFAQAKRTKPSTAEVLDQKGLAAAGTTLAKAQERGKKVDAVMQHWTKYGDAGLTSIKTDKYSDALLTFFRANGWKPKAAQKIVGIEQFGVASAIDLLMRNEQKELMLVEVKTTSGTYFTKDGGQRLAAPFETVPSSAQTHAFLEAAFQKICWEAEDHSRALIKHVFVVCASGNGAVSAYQPDPNWFAEVLADMKNRITGRLKTTFKLGKHVAALKANAKRKASAASAASAAAAATEAAPKQKKQKRPTAASAAAAAH